MHAVQAVRRAPRTDHVAVSDGARTMEVRRERYADVIDEIKPLLERHWQEIATYRDAIPLDPDYAKYIAMEEAGMLHIITARRNGVLVGYSIFFVMRHPHYQSTLFAMNDILYLLPEERRGGAGLRLIRASEREMAALGVSKISWHVKLAHDFSELLVRLGYAREEITMSKLMEKP